MLPHLLLLILSIAAAYFLGNSETGSPPLLGLVAGGITVIPPCGQESRQRCRVIYPRLLPIF